MASGQKNFYNEAGDPARLVNFGKKGSVCGQRLSAISTSLLNL